MRVIRIDASPKQLSRLRNGHRVRVKPAMEGTGFGMIVDPSKFDTMTRSFTKGSAVQLQLSPDELMANKQAVMDGEIEGEGIYTGGKINIGKAFKKAGKSLSKAAKKTGSAIVKAEKVVRKNPVTRTIVKKGLPLVASKVAERGAIYAGVDPKTAKEIGSITKDATSAGLGEAGYGMYAGTRGYGMYAGGAISSGISYHHKMLSPPSRMPEVSSISIGGNLLATSNSSLPPALQSDAMSANFHMNTQLPPQYQRGGVRFV